MNTQWMPAFRGLPHDALQPPVSQRHHDHGVRPRLGPLDRGTQRGEVAAEVLAREADPQSGAVRRGSRQGLGLQVLLEIVAFVGEEEVELHRCSLTSLGAAGDLHPERITPGRARLASIRI